MHQRVKCTATEGGRSYLVFVDIFLRVVVHSHFRLILEQVGLQNSVQQAQDVPLFLKERLVRCYISVNVIFVVDMFKSTLL
jgi:hypothetical protein